MCERRREVPPIFKSLISRLLAHESNLADKLAWHNILKTKPGTRNENEKFVKNKV